MMSAIESHPRLVGDTKEIGHLRYLVLIKSGF